MFDNGKTSLKIDLGKYLEPASNNNGSYSISDPNARIATTVTRAWTDANSNFKPDCDLVNGLVQDNRAGGGDFCGAINDLNFGKPVFSNTIDPAVLAGWGIRPNDWGLGISVQQELMARGSVEIGYFRRWFGNFTVTDNRALGTSDFTPFSVAAPSDLRLPKPNQLRGGPNLQPDVRTRRHVAAAAVGDDAEVRQRSARRSISDAEHPAWFRAQRSAQL